MDSYGGFDEFYEKQKALRIKNLIKEKTLLDKQWRIFASNVPVLTTIGFVTRQYSKNAYALDVIGLILENTPINDERTHLRTVTFEMTEEYLACAPLHVFLINGEWLEWNKLVGGLK